MKQLLKVKQQTSNAAVYGELGRVPMAIMRQIRIIKFWSKILNNPESLQYKLYNQRDVHGFYINPWSKAVKKLLDDTGFSYLWENQTISNSDIKLVEKRLYDQYLQKWYEDISNSPKLHVYNLIKNNFGFENYLLCIKNIKHRIALTRMRCSTHKLLIEEGRYRNIERENRMCVHCNMHAVENEYHFILVCPFYRDLRMQCLPKYYCHWPNIQKLNNIFKSTNNILKKLAKYIYEATERRESNM